MGAFVLEKPGQVTFTDSAPCPLLEEPYDAVLEPVVVAPCSLNANIVYGNGSKKPDNLILGHECIVQVKAVADRVRGFRIGDSVAVPTITSDWRNAEIQEGNDHHAGRPLSGNALGRSIPGVSTEVFDIVDVNMTFAKLPEGVRLKDALMCVNMVTTDFTGIEAAGLELGDTVVVLGIGAVGLMIVQGATLQGTAEIYVVDTQEISARCTFEFGVTGVLSYKDDDIREQITARTGGRGTDTASVCDGNGDIFRKAIDMARYGIDRVVNLKYYPGDDDIGIPKLSSDRGMAGRTVHLELCRGGRTRMEWLLRLVKAGGIEPERMVTYRLEGFPTLTEGLELMRRKSQDLTKVMVRLSPGGEGQQT